jgi:hypothetical protein
VWGIKKAKKHELFLAINEPMAILLTKVCTLFWIPSSYKCCFPVSELPYEPFDLHTSKIYLVLDEIEFLFLIFLFFNIIFDEQIIIVFIYTIQCEILIYVHNKEWLFQANLHILNFMVRPSKYMYICICVCLFINFKWHIIIGHIYVYSEISQYLYTVSKYQISVICKSITSHLYHFLC